MTRRERLHRCYFHEETDRPGIYCRTLFPEADPSYDRFKACLEEHTELKGGWNPFALESRAPEEHLTEPISDDWERHLTILHTPAGDLRSSSRHSLKGEPGLHDEYLLKSREDAEKYLSLPLPEITGDDVSGYFERDRLLGDAGIVEVRLGSNPGGDVVQLFGSERFALMSVTDRDIIHRLCERFLQVQLQRVKFLLSKKLGPYYSIQGQEYIVPPLHGPNDFNDFNVKYDKPIIDLIHEAGGRVHIHCHGSVKTVLPGFLEMGCDVLHPFEAPPMGDVTAREAREIVRDRICLEGNIQIADLYEQTPEAIREQTEKLITDTFDDRKGLIVCPSASPYLRGQGEKCLPRLQAMIDTVLGWRGNS